MKVVTLDNESLRAAVRELAVAIGASQQPREFGAVVGIANGGVRIAQLLREFAPWSSLPLFTVGAKRPGTDAKRGMRRWLAKLPRWMADLLRMAESRWLRAFSKPRPRPVAVPAGLAEFMKKSNGPILIVDDAIDSGATALGAVMALKEIKPDAEVRLAVVTVTTKKPLIWPDYALYTDQTLIRFPWAADF